jgi:hypothetical protein
VDPDPGGPKTHGSGGSGSGSATLILGHKTMDPDQQLEKMLDPDPQIKSMRIRNPGFIIYYYYYYYRHYNFLKMFGTMCAGIFNSKIDLTGQVRVPYRQCCGIITGIEGTITFCLSGTGTGTHQGSGSGPGSWTGFGRIQSKMKYIKLSQKLKNDRSTLKTKARFCT